ncbi:MAG: acetate--CoA ligase family protein [Acidobacteriota bacterium]
MPRETGKPHGNRLDRLFHPRSVAVVGASRRELSIGREILHNLLDFGFTGAVYPVNPGAAAVHSLRAYGSVEKIPDRVDLAVLVVPREKILAVVRSCGRKGVGGLVVITAGFRESGARGAALEARLAATVRRYGMRMVGPNCMGLINTEPSIRLNASFAAARPIPGSVAFLSQSGALGEAILSTSAEMGIGLSHFVSLGNKTDLDGNDLLEYWENDPRVKLILMYLESFGDPARFFALARRITRTKPILVVKSGRTAAGARAAVSHTGALTSTDTGTAALLRQCGVIRVSTMHDLFILAQAFASRPLPAGRRVAVVTNAGGPGILATDALVGGGAELPALSGRTRRRLSRVLPEEAVPGNPVDLIASADGQRYRAVLEPVLADARVDAVLVIFVTPVYIDALEVARSIVEVSAAHRKTVLCCFMGKTRSAEAVSLLKSRRIPVYAFPEEAATALLAMAGHQAHRARPAGRVVRHEVGEGEVRRLLRRVRRAGRLLLEMEEAQALLTAYGIPVVRACEVVDAGGALTAARKLGYPVVLKATSPRFPHKTEVGAVRLDLRTGDEVASAFEKMAAQLSRRDARTRFFVQKMVKGDVEVILGAVKDAVYGPLLMFGLGGTRVELLGDVAFAVCPVTDREARDLLESIRGAPLLTGFRGSAPVDLAALAGWVERLSQLVSDHPEIQEIDLNPLMVGARGRPSGVVDARISVVGRGEAV